VADKEYQGGKRADNSVTFQILVNRIESLRRFIAQTANSVGFVADGLEAESTCIEGASAILHVIEVDVRNELDNIDGILSSVTAINGCTAEVPHA
jgi:hypothetical protein